ncbi:MAG: hypothetical protein HFJ55_02290 [Clostridia bacterium]|nr:hypothetical protein [Clostridia bacterium]
MSGVNLKERAFWALNNTNIDYIKEILKRAIHHIEMQDKQIETLKRKNDRLERKYWEIKLKENEYKVEE